jgi:hypothetical protein
MPQDIDSRSVGGLAVRLKSKGPGSVRMMRVLELPAVAI